MTSAAERAAELRRQAAAIEQEVIDGMEQAKAAYVADRNPVTKAAYREAVHELASFRIAARDGRPMGVVADTVITGGEG